MDTVGDEAWISITCCWKMRVFLHFCRIIHSLTGYNFHSLPGDELMQFAVSNNDRVFILTITQLC